MQTKNILLILLVFSVSLFSCEKDNENEPKACFTPNLSLAFNVDTIEFENCSSNAISCYWEFGDGQTSIFFSPNHTFSVPGVYSVKLIVFNGEMSDETIQSITIEESPLPIACIEVLGTSFLAGENIQFTSCSENADSFHWDFGDGQSSDQENPQYAYSTPGLFTVTLSVSNTYGVNSTSIDLTIISSGVLLFDGFEDYEDFALSFGEWTQIDIDGQPTWGISGVSFPNSGYSGSFIIFNPSQTTPVVNDEERFLPRSGQKYAACFSSKNTANNDWLISPEITLGENHNLSLWVKSLSDEYGPDLFSIKLIEGENDIWITAQGSPIQPPTVWTNYTYNLSSHSGKSVKVAIGCFSNDAFSMFVDDIEVKSEDGMSVLSMGFEENSRLDIDSTVPIQNKTRNILRD